MNITSSEEFLFIDNANFYAFDNEKEDYGALDYLTNRLPYLLNMKQKRPNFRYAIQIDVSNPAPIVEHKKGEISSSKIFQAESAVPGYSRQIWSQSDVRGLVAALSAHPLVDEVYFATGLFWDRISFDDSGRIFHPEFILRHPELKTVWRDGREYAHIELMASITADAELGIKEPITFWKWLFPRLAEFLIDYGFSGFHARDEFVGRAYHNHSKVGFNPDVIMQFADWKNGEKISDLVSQAITGKLSWPAIGDQIVANHWNEWQQFQEHKRFEIAQSLSENIHDVGKKLIISMPPDHAFAFGDYIYAFDTEKIAPLADYLFVQAYEYAWGPFESYPEEVRAVLPVDSVPELTERIRLNGELTAEYAVLGTGITKAAHPNTNLLGCLEGFDPNEPWQLPKQFRTSEIFDFTQIYVETLDQGLIRALSGFILMWSHDKDGKSLSSEQYKAVFGAIDNAMSLQPMRLSGPAIVWTPGSRNEYRRTQGNLPRSYYVASRMSYGSGQPRLFTSLENAATCRAEQLLLVEPYLESKSDVEIYKKLVESGKQLWQFLTKETHEHFIKRGLDLENEKIHNVFWTEDDKQLQSYGMKMNNVKKTPLLSGTSSFPEGFTYWIQKTVDVIRLYISVRKPLDTESLFNVPLEIEGIYEVYEWNSPDACFEQLKTERHPDTTKFVSRLLANEVKMYQLQINH